MVEKHGNVGVVMWSDVQRAVPTRVGRLRNSLPNYYTSRSQQPARVAAIGLVKSRLSDSAVCIVKLIWHRYVDARCGHRDDHPSSGP